MSDGVTIIKYGEVVSVDDDKDADRIKVRIYPDDNSKTFEELPYAFPLLPKVLHVKPKVNEGVFVFCMDTSKDSQRFYIGPVISQDHRLFFDTCHGGGDSFFRGGKKDFDAAPSTDGKEIGTLPCDNDIVIRGRKNADIQITYDDIRIKAGVKVVDDSNTYKMAFNIKNPSYAKFKYHTKELIDGSKSTATIVADKIAFLSNTSKEHINDLSLTDTNDLITDESLNNVIQQAYRLPYGEKLIDFLKTFVDAFVNHTHDFTMLKPNPWHTGLLNIKKTEMLDNKQMLSNTIRIN